MAKGLPGIASDSARTCTCGGKSSVIDVRDMAEHGQLYRRRACVDCGARWTTYEVRKEWLSGANRIYNAVREVARDMPVRFLLSDDAEPIP